MKKKTTDALGVICVGCILASCAVTNEKGDPFIVNYVLLGIAAITGLISKLSANAGRR